MHRPDDFIPHQPHHDRVDVSELILDRGGSTGNGHPAHDGRVPPRVAPVGVDPRRRDHVSHRRPRGGLAVIALTALAVLSAGVLAGLLIVPLGWQDQAIAGTLLIAGAIALSALSLSPTCTMALMGISLFATLRYGYWRVVQTWEGVTSAGHIHQWDVVFVFLLLGAEFYAFATLALGYFQTLRPLRRPAVPLPGPPEQWPTVDVLIPTYNEPLDVVRATVLGALALDYPADRIKVFLLDDGRRGEFKQFAERVGVGYVTRDNNAHAKAGNINAALARTNGELVAIFDCDHVPTRSFLQMTLGWFARDHRLGLVQTPHHFYSPDPFERNLGQFRKVPNEGALFHRLVQDGNDLWNASFFCGSCAVLRRDALDEIGGIAVETVTEDAHTALRMQRRGWNTAYINVPQAAGLATESLSAHIGQRVRWARGMVQILRLENPLFARGLTFAQRLCYFNATTHFLFAIPRLIFLMVPLTYLLFGIVNIYGYSLAVFAYAMPHLVLAHLTNNRIQRGFRSAFWNEIYEAVLAPYILIPTVLALISPRLGKFNVTAKGGVVERSYFDRRVAWPFIVLLGLNVAGLFAAYQRFVTDPAHHDTVVMNAIWTVYNIIILAVGASVARERLQRRHEVRLDVRVPLTLVTADGRGIAGISSELSRHGATGRFERPVLLPRHSPVTIVLNSRGAACQLEARTVSDGSRRELHVVFPRLTTAQERALVDVMYSRPEAWLRWDDGQTNDSPLRSLSRVMWLSIRGLVIVLAGMLAPPRLHGHGMVRQSRHRKRSAATAASAVLIAMLGSAEISAAQQSATPVRAADSVIFRDAYQLKEIADQELTTLQRDGGALNFFFGVPITKVISQATLGLRYSAPLVVTGEARLELLLNGSRVSTLPIEPGRDQQVELTLPADLLTTDNALTVRLEGRCRACARARAPWITIDNRSRLAIAGSRLPLGNDLSLLPIPFADAASRRALVLPVAFSATPDKEELKAAALVASWFGVFADERSVRFPVSVGEVPAGNAVVIVRREPSIDAFLSLPPTPRSLVAIRDNPGDPYGKLLVVAGDGPADLLAAARTLVSGDGSRVKGDLLAARDFTPASLGQYDAPRWLHTDRPAAIGLYTTAERMRVAGSGSINVYLRLPPDLFLSARQSVPLTLRFTYGGVPPGAQAAVHVRLNAQDVDTIRLQPSSTAVRREEIVRLPTGRLRPYTNTLTIDVDFGRTAVPEDVGQWAAIDRQSTIDLRGLPHSVVLPRLELVADAGYPFTTWPDLGGTAMVLSTQPTPGEYETVLNMVGFFGAQTGSPAGSLTIVTSDGIDDVRDKDLIVIGTPASQPLLLAWTDRMPLAFTRDSLAINTAAESDLWLHPKWPFRRDDRERLARLVAAGYTFDAVLEHFVSPLRPDRSVVAIVPGDDGGGIAASAFTSSRSGPVYGGVAVARAGRFESFLLGVAAYRAGQADDYQRAYVLLLEHYWLIPPAVLIAALVIGARVHVGVERVAARRLIASRFG